MIYVWHGLYILFPFEVIAENSQLPIPRVIMVQN